MAPYSPYKASQVAAWVSGRPFAEIVAPYFTEVLAAIRSELFDTLGHLDYVKKYVAEHIPPAAFAAAPETYEPLLQALVETGRGSRSTAPACARRRARPIPQRGSWSATGPSGDES